MTSVLRLPSGDCYSETLGPGQGKSLTIIYFAIAIFHDKELQG